MAQHDDLSRCSLNPGELVAGRYLILKFIGRGGMGEVYEASDSYLQEKIALKTLRAGRPADDAVVKRFQKEVQLARKVTHPNVCRVFETGVHEAPGRPPLPFFTMELLTGETLQSRIHRLRRLSRADAFPIARQMAAGLQAAHAAGVVHADFKGGNVFLVPAPDGERAVITDFGLARIDPAKAPLDETRSMSLEHHVAGTMAYMSPEQMNGDTLTPASDLYSFGIVLFEMASGQLPFDKHHLVQAAVQRATSESASVRDLVPHIDSRWDRAIRRCLERDPARRFSSAADLADCFREGGWRVPIRYWRRREWLLSVAATLLPILALTAAFMWSRRPYQPRADALVWYRKGEAALHSMTYEAARKAFEQAVNMDPAFGLAGAGLAQAYDEMDYSDLAEESMLRAMSAAQESRLVPRDALRLHALENVISRDYPRAAPLFRRLEDTADARERPAAALESGWLAEKRDDTEAAAAAYQRALKLDPAYAPAKLRLGYIQGRRRQVDAALQSFRDAENLYQAASNYEGVTEALYQRARLLNRSSRSAEAMPIIEQALASAAAISSTYQQIGLQLALATAARNLGDLPRATALAQQAIDSAIAGHMDNLATNGMIELGNRYLASGDWPSAEPVFRRALELAGRARVRSTEARARASLASLCQQQHRTREAREYLEAALPFYRQSGYRRELVQAMGLLADVDEQLAEFEKAERLLHETSAAAEELHDRQTEDRIRERLSENLRDQGRWPEALAVIEQLLKSDPVYARINSADLYWRMGRRDDSARLLREAEQQLERRPNAQLLLDLRIVQARIAYREGRDIEALAAARRASDAATSDAAKAQARLVPALLSIRSNPASADSAIALADDLEHAGMLLDAAAARLQIAEALIASPKNTAAARSSAAALSSSALRFFEPRKIFESVWRAHAAAGFASPDPEDSKKHFIAARSALDSLRTQWSADAVAAYLRRPDLTSPERNSHGTTDNLR